MFRPFISLFASVGLAFTLPACAQPAPAPQKDADPALWVVRDKDTTIYLFGTIHVLKPGLTWFDEAVKKAFDRSGTLVLEMVEPDQETQQKVVVSKAFDPVGPTLVEKLPAEKRAAFVKALEDNKLPRASFERMQPWFAAISLSVLPVQKLGYDAGNGPEGVLTRAAKAQKKQVMGLETFEGQMSIFDSLSQKAQLQLLSSTVEELPKAGETMDRMVEDWAKGNPDGLAATMNESLKDSPEVSKALLVDRNAKWAEWIAERMRTPGRVFIAVGAGHLAGPQSVQAQLGKYKLKAVRVKY
ncbi:MULTISPECIES: TraB/GumN family protein [unclassified Sphingomonas]|uniref:TraB/GumN family protein n=1 Tax=unclassified Sphingomonas TaxID=196159 RepID=UPI001D10D312|nr:TraB/GumN family protein [Sphingomonas sp. IC4-52]MCC2979136.1 TraB/GumN family protein [Sphingomonas sp. IC4-52]MCD2315630.1 TraB/GumN family protein [Sphingomonas sp. IC-11]